MQLQLQQMRKTETERNQIDEKIEKQTWKMSRENHLLDCTLK